MTIKHIKVSELIDVRYEDYQSPNFTQLVIDGKDTHYAFKVRHQKEMEVAASYGHGLICLSNNSTFRNMRVNIGPYEYSSPSWVSWYEVPYVEVREDIRTCIIVHRLSGPMIIVTDSARPTIITKDMAVPLIVALDESKPTIKCYSYSHPTVIARNKSKPAIYAYGSSKPTIEAYDDSEVGIMAIWKSSPTIIANSSREPIILTKWRHSKSRIGF